MIQTKVAWASKRHHADKILATRPDGFWYCSRWLETANLSINAAKPASQWMEENFSDIRDCDFLIVYAEPGETLKTALVEVGWAMAWGKPVFVVGDHDSYRPWRANKRRVTFCVTKDEALDIIKRRVSPKREVLNAAGEVVAA